MDKLFNVVLIETNNTCTRNCWFCKFGQSRKDGRFHEMNWITVQNIINNLADIQYSGRISWFWINEPLLESRIYDIIKLTRIKCGNAFLSLNTNGDLLDEKVYWKLRKDGLDALGVSIYDDATYDKIMHMQYDENLVIIDMREPDYNDLENRAGNIKNNWQAFEVKRQYFENNSCARPFTMIVVNPKGDVVLCCADLYGDVVMGNVNEHRLETIWNTELFEQYRTTLNTKGRTDLKLCSSCSHSGRSSSVFYPKSQDEILCDQFKNDDI